ncbi:MAG: rhodanese-like domain-containing protein [Clostridium sp.]
MNSKVINVNDLDNLLEKINLIDIREDFEVSFGTLKGAKNIPMEELLINHNKYLNKNNKYYIMCQSGMRSSRTTSMLLNEGYNVINVGGGFGSYIGSKIQ